MTDAENDNAFIPHPQAYFPFPSLLMLQVNICDIQLRYRYRINTIHANLLA